MRPFSALSTVVLDVPVDPDAPDARQLLLDELGKPEYAAARPTLIDRIAQAIQDWLGSFQGSGDGSVPNIFPLVVTVLVVGLIVAAFFVFGRPRLQRRSAVAGALFSDDDDTRTSAELRSSAQRAAAAGDFAWVPRGTAHTFANASPDPLHVIGFATPGGIEHQFAEQWRYLTSVDAPDPQVLDEIGKRHGAPTLGPPIRATNLPPGVD